MARRIADYIALALISNITWDDDQDVFSRSFNGRQDFNGDFTELREFAAQKCGFPVTDDQIAEAARTLADCGLLRITDDNFSGTFVKIKSGSFSDFIERANSEFQQSKEQDDDIGLFTKPSDYPAATALMKHELFEDYHELGDKWLKRALSGLQQKLLEDGKLPEEGTSESSINVPAADRIVTVDHNSAEYVTLIEVTEKASESIRTSNSIDEDKRSWIRIHIATGLEFIKNHKVLAAAVSALLLKPLLNAYESVTEEPAKLAIQAAIDAVRALFGV